MAVRVSSNQMVYNYELQLNAANERMSKLMEQGDGQKLHRPSDDAVNYAKYLRYSVSENENTQYTTNVGTATSWMKTSDSALVSMTQIQTTFKEKTIQAAVKTNDRADMAAIGKEMMSEIQQIVSLGNTQQGDRYVFAGQSDLTQPFTLSQETMMRGVPKTLDDKQKAFFTGADESGSMTQMLTVEGTVDGKQQTFYLNTRTGKLYSEDMMNTKYKDLVAKGQMTVTDADAAGTIAGTAPLKVADYFTNQGLVLTAGSTAANQTVYNGQAGAQPVTLDAKIGGQNVKLNFTVIHQQIATYHGDPKYISMVKKNGSTEPEADTVNVTGQDMFGSDIFDDANSGNKQSGTAMLNEMLTVQRKTVGDDVNWLISDGQTISDVAHSTTLNAEMGLGARRNLYDSVDDMLSTQNENITKDITDTTATDVAKLAVQLMQSQTIYNMSLALGSKILPPSLADYLR